MGQPRGFPEGTMADLSGYLRFLGDRGFKAQTSEVRGSGGGGHGIPPPRPTEALCHPPKGMH